MKAGDLGLTVVPQADGQHKLRPVVLLQQMPPFSDYLVCGVSSQIQHCVHGFDEVLHAEQPGFQATGLIGTSLIRLGFLAVVPPSRIKGVIGTLPEGIHRELAFRLARVLTSNWQ